MSQEIIDLDGSGIIRAPKRARLHGRVYKLPGDIPAALLVRIGQVGANPDATDEEAIKALYDELLAAFQLYNPDVDRLPLGLTEMIGVVNTVYSAAPPVEAEVDDEDPDRVPPPSPSTTTSKPRARKSRSST